MAKEKLTQEELAYLERFRVRDEDGTKSFTDKAKYGAHMPNNFSETTLRRVEEMKIFLALNPIPEDFLPKRSKA